MVNQLQQKSRRCQEFFDKMIYENVKGEVTDNLRQIIHTNLSFLMRVGRQNKNFQPNQLPGWKLSEYILENQAGSKSFK